MIALAIGAVVAASLAWTLGLPLLGIEFAPTSTELVQTAANAVVQAVGTVLLLRAAARQQGRRRVAWGALGLAALFGTLGTVVWSTSMLTTGTTETQTAVDVLYALALVTAAGGIAALPASPSRSGRIRLVDSAILGLATMTLVWVTPVDTLADGRTLPGLPTVDVFEAIVLATLLVAASAVARCRPDRSGEVGLAAGALMCSSVGLLLYAAPGTGYPTTSRVADAVFICGFSLSAAAALRLGGPARVHRRRGSDRGHRWLAPPEVATVVTLMAITVHENVDSTPVPSLIVGTSAVGLALVRLVQLGAEQRRLGRSLRESADLLYHEARTDRLTGLGNRLAFEERLHTLLAVRDRTAVDERTPISLAFVDVDHFKRFNDALGHGVGDGMLVAAAQRVADVLGPHAYRVGGDEFVAVLDNADGTTAERLAGALTHTFATPVEVEDHELDASVSIGVATLVGDAPDPEPGNNAAAELIRRADLALYRAKELGRGRWVPYSPWLAQRAEHERRLRQGLQHADERGELEVRHQPVVDLATRRVVGTTVGAYWRSEEHGLLGPDTIGPIAVEGGLLPMIAGVLFEEIAVALRPGPGSVSEGLDQPLWVGTSLSCEELVHPALTEAIIDCVARSSSGAPGLRIDVTEETVVDDAALEVIAGLRQLGVHVTVEAFGTGPSSLLRLSHYPASSIRIDSSFVHGLGRRRNDTIIVTAVAGLAADLGLELSADGIEEEFQATYLHELGVTSARGRLFGEAMAPDEFLRWRRATPEACAVAATRTEIAR